VPRNVSRILDLGTGDGRLLALLRRDRPRTAAVRLDFSELMLGAARRRFAGDAGIEHVASPTHHLHLAFYAAIGELIEHEDPSDRLLDVESQLAWLREAGFDDVDCYWKWREMALLAGVRPAAT